MHAIDSPTIAPRFARHSAAATLARFAAIWLIASAVYYLLTEYLFQHGFIALNLMFFSEKAQLALSGAPPRLVNIGFVYPPLSFVLMLPLRNPVATQAIISGAVVAAVFRFLDHRVAEAALRRIAKAYVALSPLFLFPALENYGLLLLAFMLALVVFYIGRYLDYGYSLYLFAAGALYGLTFFLDFRTVYLLVVFVPAILFSMLRESRSRAVGIAVAISVPMIWMALGWMYINWVFLGDGLAFVHGRGSFFSSQVIDPHVLAVAGDPFGTVRLVLLLIAVSLPVTAAYFIGFTLLQSKHLSYRLPTYAIYGFPVALLALSIYAGVFGLTGSFLILFMLTMFFELSRMRRSTLLKVALIVSLVASFGVPFLSPNSEERTLARALATGTVAPNLDEYRQVVAILAAPGRVGRVLLDDTTFYPVVALSNDPKRFILPYEYEYTTALADPRLFASFVVASRNNGADAVVAVHPSVEQGDLAGFTRIATTAHYIIFARDG